MAGEEFKVRVGVELDDASFNSLKNQINSAAQKEPIKVKVDTKEAENSVKSLKTQIESLGKTNISLSGATKIESALNDISSSVKEMKASLSSLGNVSGLSNVASSVDKTNAAFNNGVVGAKKYASTLATLGGRSITSDVESTAQAIKNINIAMKQVGFDDGSISAYTKKLDDMFVTVSKIQTKFEDNGALTLTVRGVDELGRAVTTVERMTEVLDESGEHTGQFNFNHISTTIVQEAQKIKNASSEIKSAFDKIDDIDLTFKKAGANVSSLDTKFSKISNQSKEAEIAIDKLKNAYDQLDTSIKENTTQAIEGDDTTREVHNLNEITLALENYKKAYEEATAAVKKNKAENDKTLSAEKYKNDKTNLINSIEKYKGDNSAALLKYGGQLDALIAKIKQLNGTSLNGVKQEFKELQYEIEKDGLATQSFGDKLKAQFKRYAAYFSVASVAMEATQALRQMYQQVLDIDTAMTELKRVTDLSAQGYANLYDNMIASAKQYGATLSDIINSTADWSRAGFDSDTANELAGITMMYEHIADIDYEEATQNLLTSYKGFQNQLNEQFNGDASAAATHITDVLNELDNNYAVTAAGIGEAMRRSAASMDVANNSMEQTAALITGAVEVTQDPEGAGNALKVISMRLRGAKGELEDLGEEVDDNVENVTKMQGQILNLTHGHVNIFEDNGDFKSTYDILKGIYEVWDDLTDIEQADLLETVAGKHRANTVASILGNFEDVEKAYKSALNSTGSASRENEKYMNSLQGHLNQLATAWQSFSNSFMSSGFLKGAIGTASGFLNVIDTIVDKMGTIPTIISLIAAGLSGIKNIGFFKTVKDEATGFITKMEFSFAGLKGKIGEFKNLLNNSVKFDFDKDFADSLGLNEKTLNQYIADGQKSEYLEDATDAVVDYVKATDKASISVEDFRGKQMAAATQIDGSARTFKGASNVISVFNSMTKETEKTQQGFVSAIANSNPKLASYLSSVKAGSASFKGYIGSLIGATAKTVALTAVTTALNAALTMGISFLVSAAISAIDNWIHKNEKLADSVQDVIDKYNEQKNSLKDAKAVVDEVVTSDGSKSRYEELSKGVDSLGKNISLTADEYSEYLDITSRIASTFPELIQGYDSQGNAILSCKGNVEELTEAYNKLGHAANKEILNKDSIDDIQEDFKNDIEDLNDSGFWDNELTTDATKALEKMINSSDVDSAVQKNVSGYYTQIATALHDAKIGDYESIDPYWSFSWQIKDYIADCIETDRAGVQKIVDSHNSELDDAAAEMKQAADAVLSEAFDFSDSDYYGMSDSLKTIAQQAVNNLDGEFYQKVVNSGGNIKDYINSMVKALDGIDNNGNSTIETSFDLQTKFNNGEVSYGEYADALAKAQNTIDHLEGVDGEIKAQLKLALDTKDAENQYETFVNRLTEAGWSEDAAKKFARSLSSSEMEVAFDLIAKGELKVKNADELREQLEEQAKLNEAMSFSIDMEAETEGVEALTTALTESNSATGLTVESMEKLKARYKDLDGYNPATLFQETANGLMLNASAARELEKAYAESKLSEANDNLTTLKQRYDELGVEIRECDDASKKASLINEREDIRQQITKVAEYATALEGLTSAYTDWQTAESAGSNRDMYSSIQSAMEGVKEELDLGWIDDGTKEYFDLIWGDNWNGAGKGISDYRAQWDTLDDTIEGTTYSLQDFFKTDEDGNLTSKGIYNFLDAVKQKQKELGKDWVQTDKNGNIVSFDFGIDGTKAIADALGISEDLVNIFLKASQDCGFVVNFDGTYKQLADLQNEAMAANDKLKELGKTKYTFNFDSTSVKDLKAQLKVAQDIVADKKFWNKDGTFNFNVEGATEAMTIVSTLQAKIDNLNHKYIGFTVEDDELEKPLSILQDYEAQVDNLNQLKLNPVFNADSIEAGEENLNDLAQQMIDLPDSIKSRLKIDGIDDVDDMRKKIESGEIKIPTTLDIQTSINDNLEDLVKLSLLNSGLLNEDEKVEIEQELKVKYNISDDSDTAEDLEKSVHDRFADYSGTEDLDADVNVNVEGEQDVGSLIDYLGDLSDEQIQVIANVVGKVDVEQLQSAINDIDDDKYIKLIAEALGSGDVNALADAINNIPDENVKKAIAKAFGYNSVEELDNAIRGMDNKTVKAVAQALGISDVNSLKSVVNSLDDKTVQAIAEAIGQGKVQSLIDTIAGLHNKKVTITTVMTTVKNVVTNAIKNGSAAGKVARNNRFGSSNVDGTAFAEGTINNVSRRGNWGTKGSGKALVGELGQELLVRDGQYYTIGDNGAEFIDYKKGDIIFNAGQTRQLFEQGKIVNGQTRGRAYANGTAFAPGTAGGTMYDLINAAILYGKDRVTDDDQSASGTASGTVWTPEFNGSEALDTLDKLNEALAESESETGLTAEGFDDINKAFKDLKSFNPSKMFIKTANGVKVNRQEFAKCKQELIATNKAAASNDMSNLVNQYNELTAAIGNATEASSRTDNIKKRNAVKEQMLALAQHGIAYSTNNDNYNEWLNSQSMPEGKDAYGAIAQYKSQVQEDIDNGWFTNTDKAYVGLLTGLDAATASVDEAWAAWKSTFDKKIAGGQYSIQDVFTVDDDGNVTSDGVDRFMEGIQTDFKDDIYKFNEDTGEWYYDFSEENVQKIQDIYGMGIDSIGIMLEAAAQAGYDVDWGDMFDLSKYDIDTTPIDQLISLAELAETELSKLGKNVDFNFSADNLADADAEIERAHTELSEFLNEDGTINFDVEGADKAAAIMAMLTIQKNQLTAPAFMTVDTSQLTGANTVIGDYVAKAQQFQEAMENYRIAAASGSTEQIEQASQNLTNAATDYQNAASALSESNPEVAVQLGADDAQVLATQVQDALNNGDMTVQAKAEITEGVTDKLSQKITVPAIAEITHVSESKLVNEDAYNASVDLQIANVNSNLPGVQYVDGKLIFDSSANIIDISNNKGDKIYDVQGNIIGFTDEGKIYDMQGNVTGFINDGRTYDMQGNVTGFINEGKVYNANGNIIGFVSEGKIYDMQGNVTGFIGKKTYDMQGNVTGFINNGKIYDVNGNVIGFVNKGKAYDMQGNVTGFVNEGLIYDVNGNVTGFTNEGKAYDMNGNVIGFVNNGEIYGMKGDVIGFVSEGKHYGVIGDLTELNDSNLTDEQKTVDVKANVSEVSTDDVEPLEFKSAHQTDPDAPGYTDEELSEIVNNGGRKIGVLDDKSRLGGSGSSGILADIIAKPFNTAFDWTKDLVHNVGQATLSAFETVQQASSDAGAFVGKAIRSFLIPSIANAEEVDTSQNQPSNIECIPAHLVANDVDTSGVTDADGDVDVPAEAQVDKVNDPNGVLNDPFQVAVDDSGIKDALQDGETLRSMLLGLDDDTLMAFGNIAPGFQNVLGSAQELRDTIADVPADGLLISFSAVYDGLGDALTSAEAFNEYLNSITDEGQRQVIIDLVVSKESKEQELTADVTGNTTKLDEAVEKPRETTSIIVPDVARVLSRMAQGFNAVARITPQLTTNTLTVAVNTLVNSFTKTGSSKADGTAYANGTVGKAFKHGNWGTGDSGTALVGELGQEMVVRDGQFFTIGDNGAEFFQYKKNDIIFNAGQTKQLFDQGKITNGKTRGRAFSGGWNATASKNNFGNEKKNYKSNSSSSSGSGSSSGSNSGDSDASDEADEFEETLDWIETKIDRIERAISKLDTTASSVYKNWGTRNEALVNQISKVGEEINLQQQAYDRYIKQANSVGLSEDYASKVRDGTIDIETITDEDLNDKISDYKEW